MQLLSVKAKYCCGIDLHARTMYCCVMTRNGNVKYHQQLPNDEQQFLAMLEAFLPSMVVGVESTYNWYWLADICTAHNIPFHVGHALYIKRFTARKQANDRIDSRSIAELLRTNRFPLAYRYPREMRITRDLLRRRHMFVRRRAGTYTHMQNSYTQYGQFDSVYDTMRSKTERRNLPPRFDDTELRFNAERDCDYLEALDGIIWKLDRRIRKQAVYHDPVCFTLLQTVPGIGRTVALTVLYEAHTMQRLPTAQHFSSCSRVVKAQLTSAGKSKGGIGGESKIGNPYLKWAFSEAAVAAVRSYEPIKKLYQRLERKYGKRRAYARIEHRLAVAVYFILKKRVRFDMKRFLGQA